MASVYSITTEGEEALGAATAETILQLRGSTATKAKILSFGLFFDGASPTAEPVRVRFLRQTSDGTGSGATEAAWDPDNPTANCTGFHSFSAEPSAGEVLLEVEVHPQAGYERFFELGREPCLDNAATSRIGIECTAPAAVNVVGYLVFEE